MAFCTKVIVRNLSMATAVQASIKNLTVIGGGLMGAGIAQVAAQTGHNVTLVDLSQDVLSKSKENMKHSLSRIAKKKFADNPSAGKDFIEKTLEKIVMKTDPSKAVSDCDLVIEAIVEKLQVKQELFKKLDEISPKHTIFASNTSSLPISEIAETSQRKDRFGGLHFFNPVPMMKLLEVIRIKETSDETYKKLMEFGQNMGKECVTCKDTPGFIVNRLLLPYKAEAVKMLERGDASAKDIDTAMRLGLGYPMGPFELSDYTGLDTSLFVLEGWEKRFPNDPIFKVPETIKRLVKEGKLGRKTGEGFYKY